MQIFKGLALTLILGTAVACTPTFRNHGYVPSDAELENILVGVDTRDTVDEAVGRPTAAGVLDEGGYYYVRNRVRVFGPREPQVVDRQIVAISFDEAGVVSNIERFGLERGRVVTLSRRVTDSNTQGVSFIRQLIGNLGNFNPGELLN